MFQNNAVMFDEASAGGGSASAPAGDGDQGQSAGELSFDKWIESQDEKVKGLLEGHTKGLKSALDSERETRKGFEKQIKDLMGKAEKGSEAERQLGTLLEQAEATNRKAAFYEEAHTAGIANLKLAFIVASTEGLFDKKGNVDFATMKTSYPELFAKPLIKGNAGEGTDSAPTGKSMNDIIRRAAGVS
jgi:hypothetical protein